MLGDNLLGDQPLRGLVLSVMAWSCGMLNSSAEASLSLLPLDIMAMLDALQKRKISMATVCYDDATNCTFFKNCGCRYSYTLVVYFLLSPKMSPNEKSYERLAHWR
jgi:hypothetical protein